MAFAKTMTVADGKIDFSKFGAVTVKLTGSEAETLLERNVLNRKISEQVIATYSRDMAKGRWHFTGAPVSFDENGELLDGQQRLTAHARHPELVLEYLVLTGLSNESQRYMDQGRRRTAAQQLSLLGYTNSARLASAARMCILWDMQGLFGGNKLRPQVSTAEIEEWLVEHSDTTEALGPRVAQAESAAHLAFLYKAYELAPEDAIEFHDALETLIGLDKGSPILALEQRLRRVAITRERVAMTVRLAYFIQAWNGWCEGRKVTKLYTPKNGWNAENFPLLRPGRGDYEADPAYKVGVPVKGVVDEEIEEE